MSFVQGVKNVDFLKRRVEQLNKNVLFSNMEITDNKEKLLNGHHLSWKVVRHMFLWQLHMIKQVQM